MPSQAIASSSARCKADRPPGNFISGQSFTICNIVCRDTPQEQDGSEVWFQQTRLAAHRPHRSILSVMLIFVNKVFTPLTFHCLSTVQKHLARTCGSTAIADSQTAKHYQMSIFNGKTHQNYLTSSNENLTFTSTEYLIHHKHSLKILCKSKHFPGDTEENVSGCFFF